MSKKVLGFKEKDGTRVYSPEIWRVPDDKLVPVVSLQVIKEWCKKQVKVHQKEEDCDGFPICPIVEVNSTVIAPKGEYIGTEEERLKSENELIWLKENTDCGFCSLIDDLLFWAEKEAKKGGAKE